MGQKLVNANITKLAINDHLRPGYHQIGAVGVVTHVSKTGKKSLSVFFSGKRLETHVSNTGRKF